MHDLNTPQFTWVRTRGLTRTPRPVAPVHQPEVAARAIVWAAAHGRREVWVGEATVATILGNRLAPWFFDRYLARTAYEGQQTDVPLPADREDYLDRVRDDDADAGDTAPSTTRPTPSASMRGCVCAGVARGEPWRARDCSPRGDWRARARGSADGVATRNTIHVDVPPERVFAVLSDARCYEHWVVGARRIRDFDPEWPAKGTVFRHALGVGPLTLHDHSRVVEVDPPRLLVLLVQARPFGTGLVRLTLAPEAAGCLIDMVEGPGGRLTRLVWSRVADALVHRRNDVSLRRLKALAEGGRPAGRPQ